MTFRLDYYDAGRARRDRAPLGADPRRRDRRRRRRARSRARSRGTPRDREPDPAPRARRRRGAPRRARSRPTIAARGARAARGRRGRARADRPRAAATRSSTKFGGGPVGLSTLAVALGEEPDTIEDVYEPYLLQLGFLQRTPRGRIVTDARAGPRRRRPGGASRQPVLSARALGPGARRAASTSCVAARIQRLDRAVRRRAPRSSELPTVESRARRRLALPARDDHRRSRASRFVTLGRTHRLSNGAESRSRRSGRSLQVELQGRPAGPAALPAWRQTPAGRLTSGRYCSSCQDGTGASSSSARPPSRLAVGELARSSSSHATSSRPSLTRWSSQAPRKTSLRSQ